jgi:hypothetical protein
MTKYLLILILLAFNANADDLSNDLKRKQVDEMLRNLKKGDETLIQEAQNYVSNKMKDPESTNFRNVFVNKSPKAVCGEFKSKNSYGAYTGYKLFFYDPLIQSSQLNLPENEWVIFCNNK